MKKKVFTTGEVAKVCDVSIQMVIKWFDGGDLEGYKIPGSRDRRIPREHLVAFMEKNKIPLNFLTKYEAGLGSDGFDKGKRVLIADDEVGILEVLERSLETIEEVQTETASSGLETGLRCYLFKPHLLILDHNLEDSTSRDLLPLLKMDPQLKDVKIIIISGYLSDEEAAELLKEGVDAYIAKPFDLEEVKKVVRKLLELD
jgi:excisionase family DNA binding protein